MSTSTQHASFPATDFTRIGPPIGARFPDLRLPDQHGRVLDLHAARGTRKAAIVFHRSAKW